MELGFDTLFLVLWGKSNGKDLTDSNIWVEPGPFTLIVSRALQSILHYCKQNRHKAFSVSSSVQKEYGLIQPHISQV